MTYLAVGEGASIFYVSQRPLADLPTFVFINSMGATCATWEAEIGPMLRASGFGTLAFDFRGQGKSRYGHESTLLPDEIISDICRLLEVESPARPILVGLSVGGMFAMRSYLRGAPAEAIVLINTLRKPSAMVEWISALEARLLSLGGMPLVMDVFRPSLCSPEELTRLRPNRLQPGPYEPWAHDHPRHRMASGVRLSDWDIPYEELGLPVLVLSGLHDRLFRVAEDVDELVQRLPSPVVVDFPDAGHALHEERTERFVEVLAEFGQGPACFAVERGMSARMEPSGGAAPR